MVNKEQEYVDIEMVKEGHYYDKSDGKPTTLVAGSVR